MFNFPVIPSPSASLPTPSDSWVLQVASLIMMTATLLAVVGIAISFFVQDSLALMAFIILGITGLTGFWILRELQILMTLDNDVRHVALSTNTVQKVNQQAENYIKNLKEIVHTLELRQKNIFLQQDPTRIQARNKELYGLQETLLGVLEMIKRNNG